jgi:hypothetical protein
VQWQDEKKEKMKLNGYLLLALVLSSAYAFAGEELVGKTFWVGTYSTSPKAASPYELRRMLGIRHLEPVRVRIAAYDSNHYGIEIKKYEVEMPSGEKHWVNAALIDNSIESGVLLTYDPVAKQKEQEAAEARKAKVAAAKRSAERISLIKAKKWPANIEKAVLEGKVQIGMTDEQVRMSLGKPVTVNRTVTANTVTEQWVYGSSTYLYFRDGVLTSWQESR